MVVLGSCQSMSTKSTAQDSEVGQGTQSTQGAWVVSAHNDGWRRKTTIDSAIVMGQRVNNG